MRKSDPLLFTFWALLIAFTLTYVMGNMSENGRARDFATHINTWVDEAKIRIRAALKPPKPPAPDEATGLDLSDPQFDLLFEPPSPDIPRTGFGVLTLPPKGTRS